MIMKYHADFDAMTCIAKIQEKICRDRRGRDLSLAVGNVVVIFEFTVSEIVRVGEIVRLFTVSHPPTTASAKDLVSCSADISY